MKPYAWISTMVSQNILVTGGAGFIGSHLVYRLTRDSRKITVLDDLSTGRRENLAKQIREKSVSLVHGDIKDSSLVNELSSDANAIVHLAALVDHEACMRDPELANDINARGTLTMLEAARRHDVNRFVYASSAAIYGRAQELPISEETASAPISPYGSSKLKGEEHCLRYLEHYGLRVCCLRYFNVFGPRQSASQYSGVITEFMKKLSRDEPLVIYGDGLQTRDFVNVRDIVEATGLSLDSDLARGVYNIATGEETTINSLADILLKTSGKTLTRIHAPTRQGDIIRSVANISRAKTELHFTPKTNLENDLLELWKWEQEDTTNI